MKTIATLTTAILLVTNAAFSQKTGLELAREAEKADNGWGSSSNTLTMTLTNRNGQDCYKVERYPVSTSSGYKRNIVWFNPKNSL